MSSQADLVRGVFSISAKTRRTVVVFPVPGGASEDGVSRSAPPEGRVDEVREFLQLGVAVVEVLGEVGVIEDVDIPDEGVIVMVSHRSLWGRG